MRGVTHALAGLCIGLAMAQTSQPLGGVAMGLAASVGALLPDIDHPRSIVGRRAGFIGGALRLAISHRGMLHSGIAAAIVVLVALLAPAVARSYALAAAAGYSSHILLDALTVQGVPLFWPSRRRFSILPLRTGGLIEMILRGSLFILVLYIIAGAL